MVCRSGLRRLMNVGVYSTVVVFFAWALWKIREQSVPLRAFDTVSLHNLIENEEPCGFSLFVEEEFRGFSPELKVRGGDWLFLTEKFDEALLFVSDSQKLWKWLRSQLFILHFYEEVLICEKFLIATLALSVLNIVTMFMYMEPLVPGAIKDRSNREFVTSPPDFRRFVSEKFIVLATVIIRTPESISRERRMLQGSFSSSFVLTDVTIFSVWYVFLWSISSTVGNLTARFEEAILPGKYSSNDWHSVPFLKLSFLLFACCCTSISTVSFTVSSYRLLHPLYTAIVVLESVEVLQRCCYSFTLFLYSTLHKDVQPAGPNCFAKFLSDLTHDVIFFALFCLYIYIALFVNNKLLALCFVPRAASHLYGLLTRFSSQ